MAVILRQERQHPELADDSAGADIDLGGAEFAPLDNRMDCNRFEEALSDYFDGLLVGQEMSLFRAHALQCRGCRSLMDDVKATISVCKQLDELEPPAMLDTMLAEIPLEHGALGCSGFAGRLIPLATQSARWTFATAGSLAFATFALLLFGFSDDGTVSGIYRQAHVKVSELYTQGAEVYTKTDQAVARLERVGLGIGEFWDAL